MVNSSANKLVIVIGGLVILFGITSIICGVVEAVVWRFDEFGAFEFWLGIFDMMVGAFCIYAGFRAKRSPTGIALILSIVLAILGAVGVACGSAYYYERMRNDKVYCDGLDYREYQLGVSRRSLRHCERFYIGYGMLVLAIVLGVLVIICSVVEAGALYAWKKRLTKGEKYSTTDRSQPQGSSNPSRGEPYASRPPSREPYMSRGYRESEPM